MMDDSEHQFARRVLDSLFAFVGVLELDGTLIEANRAPLEAAGIGADEVIGKKFWDCYWWSYSPQVQAQLRDAIDRARSGEVVRYEVPVRMAGDSRVWIDFQLAPMRDDTGRITHLVPSALDISDRRLADQALRENEERLRRAHELLEGITEDTRDLIAAQDTDFRYVAFNRAYRDEFRRVFGPQIEVGTSMLEALAHLPAEQCKAKALWGRAMKGEAFEVTEEFGDPGRDRRFYEMRYSPLRDRDGGLVGASQIVRDVTEREHAEQALRDSEARYRTLFENMTEGFGLGELVIDATGRPVDIRFVEVNAAFERQSGLSRDQILDRPIREALPQLEQVWIDAYTRVAMTGETAHFQEYAAGLGRHFSVYSFRPTPGRFAVIFTDITHRVRAEEALRRSEARWNAAIENFAEGVIIATADEQVIYWNPAARAMHGFTRDDEGIEPLEKTPITFELWTPDGSHLLSLDEWPMRRIKRGETVRDLELRLRRPDQRWERFVSYSGAMVQTAAGERLIFLSVHDLTLQRRAEETLRESEERFRTLAENISQLAWMADEKGWIYWYNRRWYDYTGATLEQTQGWGWTTVHHPDHVERVIERISRSWDTGEPWEDTFPLRGRDGTYRWFLSRALPIRNEQGQVTRWFGTSTDVTEQRAAEQALRAADRRKDEFLATLAHELRNPLAPVRQGAAVALSPGASPAQVRWSLEVIERQSKHMALLLDDLLDVSRITRGRFKINPITIEVAEVVHAAIETARPHIDSRRHQLDVSLPEERMFVHGDPLRLAQVFSNLLTNAAKYTEPGGRIQLSARRDEDCVEIAVTDNGIGIVPDQLERVFEMFAQGHAPSHLRQGGLGIGLALARGLVVLHGGVITARSEGVGQGSTFLVRLPLEGRTADLPAQSSRAHANSGRAAKILVVDDNVDAAESLLTLLLLQGHQVESAHDGEMALATAETFRPDVVLLDLGMPRMDGFEVARRLRSTSEGRAATLVALTGWGQDEDRRRTRDAGFDHHLTKPVDQEALEKILNSASDGQELH
jgi:PAS domain S-box-containing protein